MPELPEHIQKAIDAGKAIHEAKRKAEEEAARVSKEMARRAEEERKAQEEAAALDWFHNTLPTQIELTAAQGKNTLEIDRHVAGPRVRLCREAGFYVREMQEPQYDYETGRREGYWTYWEISW